ncbi:hypothetical protein C8R43DRAFT_1136270 [Mycena crocata]|nr:hypothetical protein C8R43DRAFT_1136270 [Mycena crocata]
MSSTLRYVTTSPPFSLRRSLSSRRPALPFALTPCPRPHSPRLPSALYFPVTRRLALRALCTAPTPHTPAPRLPPTHLRTCSRPLRCIGAFAVCCAWAATTPARSNPRRHPFSRQNTPVTSSRRRPSQSVQKHDISGAETQESRTRPRHRYNEAARHVWRVLPAQVHPARGSSHFRRARLAHASSRHVCRVQLWERSAVASSAISANNVLHVDARRRRGDFCASDASDSDAPALPCRSHPAARVGPPNASRLGSNAADTPAAPHGLLCKNSVGLTPRGLAGVGPERTGFLAREGVVVRAQTPARVVCTLSHSHFPDLLPSPSCRAVYVLSRARDTAHAPNAARYRDQRQKRAGGA